MTHVFSCHCVGLIFLAYSYYIRECKLSQCLPLGDILKTFGDKAYDPTREDVTETFSE